MKKALLLSGYHAISQKNWSDYVIRTCSDYHWTLIDLPPRYFSWRMRGNPLSVIAKAGNNLDQDFDLILATSTIDLSVVQSLIPSLRNVPSLMFFHENQFAYPTDNSPASVIDWQMVNLYSALRADKLLFNSHYNRDSFIQGVVKLTKKLPDLVPKNIPEDLSKKSQILSVPIKNRKPNIVDLLQASASTLEPAAPTQLKILWNHRWEWDKNPELLEEIFKELSTTKLDVRFIITGQKFRKIPLALTNILKNYSGYIEHEGFVESDMDYQKLIQQADIVLSTAIHEFQGIAIMEAVQAGCVPLLPNRLSYPEFFDNTFLYSGEGTITEQAKAAVNKILNWQQNGLPTVRDLNEFTEEQMAEKYKETIKFN